MPDLNYVWMLAAHAGYYKCATAVGIDMTTSNCASLVVGVRELAAFTINAVRSRSIKY